MSQFNKHHYNEFILTQLFSMFRNWKALICHLVNDDLGNNQNILHRYQSINRALINPSLLRIRKSICYIYSALTCRLSCIFSEVVCRFQVTSSHFTWLGERGESSGWSGESLMFLDEIWSNFLNTWRKSQFKNLSLAF